ncbi:MAG: hypothetical protein E3J71_05390 [Candidatus Stahlbacteria bacterium]|nr:MAG: hypothetical protein E3J71_05390 [Candidatus Stahlbacteria bacterium]
MSGNEEELKCIPSDTDTGGTVSPINSPDLKDANYQVSDKQDVKLTIVVGHKKKSGTPYVSLDLNGKKPCKKDHPYVWIFNDHPLHGKEIHCVTTVTRLPNIDPSNLFSITYILEGGPNPQKWINEIHAQNNTVRFEAWITLYSH